MAIVYPLTLPLAPTSADFTMVDFVAAEVSEFTGQEQVFEWPGKLLRARVTYAPRPWDVMAPLLSTLTALKGPVGSFLMGDPLYAKPRGDPAQGALVVDGAGQTGNRLAVRGATANAVGLFLGHDTFQLGAALTARLYRVLNASFDVDGTGRGEIDIWPDIRESPLDGAALVTSDPVGLFRLAGPVTQREGGRFKVGIGFEAVERLPVDAF